MSLDDLPHRGCATPVLKVMSFNIRYDIADNIPLHRHSWLDRRQLVLHCIRTFDPDLLGPKDCRDDSQAASCWAQVAFLPAIGPMNELVATSERVDGYA